MAKDADWSIFPALAGVEGAASEGNMSTDTWIWGPEIWFLSQLFSLYVGTSVSPSIFNGGDQNCH